MTILTTVAAIVISFCLLDIFHTKSFNYPHFTFINLFRRQSHAKTQSRYDLITARKRLAKQRWLHWFGPMRSHLIPRNHAQGLAYHKTIQRLFVMHWAN